MKIGSFQEPFDKKKIEAMAKIGKRYSPTGYKQPRGLFLAETVSLMMWPTPRANLVHPTITEKNRGKLIARNKSNLEEVIAGHCGKATGQLNPEFVEWLMGCPIGWTDLNCSETGRSYIARSGSAKE